jgi:hypothetical protein
MKGAFGGFILVLYLLQFIYSCSKDASVLEEQAPTQYTLTVTASEGGSISPDATGIYNEGTQIGLSAIPDEGYRFVRWSGSDRDNKNCGLVRPGNCRSTFTMNSNRDVQAFFQINSE